MAMTGANVPLAKVLVDALPAEVLLLLRFALASAVLAIAVRWEPGPALRSLTLQEWSAVGVLGIFGSVLFTLAVLEGVKRTSGASAGIILAALPAVVAIIGLLLGDRLRRGEVAMIALAVAGVALIQGPATSGATGTQPMLGNLLIGCAVACEAAFVIVARGISEKVKPLRLSMGVALVSLAVCAPTGIAGLARFDWTGIEPRNWALLAWYALTASILCTALWYRGVAHVETWAAGLATTAVPVAALAVSVVVLGEEIGGKQIAGAALVIAAIALGALSRR